MIDRIFKINEAFNETFHILNDKHELINNICPKYKLYDTFQWYKSELSHYVFLKKCSCISTRQS